MKALNAILMSGREVLPLVEGGKGISVSNGESSGAWALAGGVGTFSGVNADSYDPQGRTTALYAEYVGATRPGDALVETIGRRFNEELERGRHQQHFTGYPAGQ